MQTVKKKASGYALFIGSEIEVKELDLLLSSVRGSSYGVLILIEWEVFEFQ